MNMPIQWTIPCFTIKDVAFKFHKMTFKANYVFSIGYKNWVLHNYIVYVIGNYV